MTRAIARDLAAHPKRHALNRRADHTMTDSRRQRSAASETHGHRPVSAPNGSKGPWAAPAALQSARAPGSTHLSETDLEFISMMLSRAARPCLSRHSRCGKRRAVTAAARRDGAAPARISPSAPPFPRVETLTSTQNPYVKHCVKLRTSRAYREAVGRFLVCGVTVLKEQLRAGAAERYEVSWPLRAAF
jgi:hypothetical protein